MIDIKKFGHRLAHLRRAAHLKQRDIAKLFSVSVQAVSKWERGHNCPDILIVDELAKAFGVTIEELFLFDDDKKQKSDNKTKKLPP